MSKPRIVTIVGPTASGKSALAVELARRFNGEVVGADSMQLYRYMDIGTAKPTLKERKGVPHQMIDVLDPDEPFSASDYKSMASRVIEEIHGRGKTVFLSGGTGLYVRALTRGLVDTPGGDPFLREELKKEAKVSGVETLHSRLKSLDPQAADAIHPNNLVRVIRALEVTILSEKKLSHIQQSHRFEESPYDVMMLGIDLERRVLYEKIEERVDRMVDEGLKEEVEGLFKRGYDRHLKPMRGVGYKEMCRHILDDLPLDRAIALIKRDSRRYAKRQVTWYRKEDAIWKGADRHLEKDSLDEVERFLEKSLSA